MKECFLVTGKLCQLLVVESGFIQSLYKRSDIFDLILSNANFRMLIQYVSYQISVFL